MQLQKTYTMGTANEADNNSNDASDLRKKGNAGSRSWIVLDSSGGELILDVDKYAIMHRVQIHARDLRIIDPLLSYPSAILGRERAIVLNLEHIKAIITSEEVLIRDPLDDNVVPIVENLKRRLKLVKAGNAESKEIASRYDVESGEEDDSPFEFKALEVALEAICSHLSACEIELETAVHPVLDMLTKKISGRILDRLRKLKSQMTRLTARVQKVRDELEQLLDDDDDMAELYLSRKLGGAASPVSGSLFLGPSSPNNNNIGGTKLSRGVSRANSNVADRAADHEIDDVAELERLLEAYFMQIDATFNRLTSLREYIDSTEDYINIQLDNHRNQLIQLELILSSGTMCMALYSLVAGIFGMNIPYTWNDGYAYTFKWVVILTGGFCASLFTFITLYARFKGLIGS